MDNTELITILDELKQRGISLREAARLTGTHAGNMASARLGKRSQAPFLSGLRELLQSVQSRSTIPVTSQTGTAIPSLISVNNFIRQTEHDDKAYQRLLMWSCEKIHMRYTMVKFYTALTPGCAEFIIAKALNMTYAQAQQHTRAQQLLQGIMYTTPLLEQQAVSLQHTTQQRQTNTNTSHPIQRQNTQPQPIGQNASSLQKRSEQPGNIRTDILGEYNPWANNPMNSR